MRSLVVIFSLLLISGCDSGNGDKRGESHGGGKYETFESKTDNEYPSPKDSSTLEVKLIDYRVVDWTELIPKDDLNALLTPPEFVMEIEDGSVEDQILNTTNSAMNIDLGDKNEYKNALISTRIIEAMDGEYIEIPGFIVPVGYDDKQIVTSFFLVPYFGACLHMPPPPPNQIIYIEIDQGFALDVFYEPVVISGQLSTKLFENQIATSAYTMTMDKIRLYYEDE